MNWSDKTEVLKYYDIKNHQELKLPQVTFVRKSSAIFTRIQALKNFPRDFGLPDLGHMKLLWFTYVRLHTRAQLYVSYNQQSQLS